MEEWSDLLEILGKRRDALGPLQHPEVLVAGADSMWGDPLPEPTLRLRRALRRHEAPSDWALARRAILSDSSIENRVAAALVLTNFARRDATFHLLAKALRANDNGGGAAEMVLSALARGAPRKVDWAPARANLAALLGGTNLFAYPAVLSTLVATEIDPALGRALARENPDLLLDHLEARNPLSPSPAHRFLVHVSGRDRGRDTAAWREWLGAAEPL